MTRLDWILKVGDKKYWMDSPVENFMLLLNAAMATYPNGYAAVKDTSNTARTVGAHWTASNTNWVSAQPAAANDNYGILCGSGDTAVDILNYAMETKIANGSGAGQLSYSIQTTAYGGATPNKYAKIMRTFTNNTVNPITVKEVGLAVNPSTSGGVRYYVLITRDVLPAPVAVAAGDTMPVEIYIQTTC